MGSPLAALHVKRLAPAEWLEGVVGKPLCPLGVAVPLENPRGRYGRMAGTLVVGTGHHLDNPHHRALAGSERN